MALHQNIKNVFSLLMEDIDNPDKVVSIVETYNKGEWSTIYICASKFQEEGLIDIRQQD